MSITTKTGDRGTTQLYSGEQVGKSDLRVSTCGDIDELNSALGMVRAHPDAQHLADELIAIQRTLFSIGSMVSTTPGSPYAADSALTDDEVEDLTRRASRVESEIVMPKDFVLPGGSELAARLDMARSVTRRVERSLVRVMEEGHLTSITPITWINRLSDYLWLLARREEGDLNTPRRPA